MGITSSVSTQINIHTIRHKNLYIFLINRMRTIKTIGMQSVSISQLLFYGYKQYYSMCPHECDNKKLVKIDKVKIADFKKGNRDLKKVWKQVKIVVLQLD